jgi:hypothetical protein
VKFEKGVRKECSLLPMMLFNLYSEHLTKDATEGCEDFKMGQVIHTQLQMALCYWLKRDCRSSLIDYLMLEDGVEWK